MDNDRDMQYNFLIPRFCWMSGICCSAKKVALSYFKGLKNGTFKDTFLKEGIFAVEMLLYLVGKLFLFFVR